jgi:hypothetical protein
MAKGRLVPCIEKQCGEKLPKLEGGGGSAMDQKDKSAKTPARFRSFNRHSRYEDVCVNMSFC